MKSFSQFESLEPLEPRSTRGSDDFKLGGGILFTSSEIATLQEDILPERQQENALRLKALWALLQAKPSESS